MTRAMLRQRQNLSENCGCLLGQPKPRLTQVGEIAPVRRPFSAQTWQKPHLRGTIMIENAADPGSLGVQIDNPSPGEIVKSP